MENSKHPNHYYKTQNATLRIIVILASIGYGAVLTYAFKSGDIIAARLLVSTLIITAIVVFCIAKFVDK